MKLNKTQLQKMIKEAIEVTINAPDDMHLTPKYQRLDTYKGDVSLRGGLKVTSRQPSVGDVVVFHDVDYRTDTRNYYYGKVVYIERMDRMNTTGGNMADVEAYFMSEQAKKGAKTGELTTPTKLPAPKLFNKETNDLQVLEDQKWLDKQLRQSE
jgi:hypothetical protein